MPKKTGMKKPPHGDKYKHLAALRPPFQSSSAVLEPKPKSKAKQSPRQQQAQPAQTDEDQ